MTFKNLRHQLIGAAMLGLFGLGGCQGCDEELSQVRSKMTLNPQEVELNPVPVAADTLILFEWAIHPAFHSTSKTFAGAMTVIQLVIGINRVRLPTKYRDHPSEGTSHVPHHHRGHFNRRK